MIEIEISIRKHEQILIMNKILSFLIALAMLGLAACHSASSPISQLESLAEELSGDTSNYTQEDWEAVGEQLEEIEEEIQAYRDQYTAEELQEISRLEGKCIGIITKKVMNAAEEEVEIMSQQAEWMMEGFKEGYEEYE